MCNESIYVRQIVNKTYIDTASVHKQTVNIDPESHMSLVTAVTLFRELKSLKQGFGARQKKNLLGVVVAQKK